MENEKQQMEAMEKPSSQRAKNMRIRRRKKRKEEESRNPISVAIVGGGPAGMEAAAVLASQGLLVHLFEANGDLAANLLNKYKLFPDFSTSGEVAYPLISALEHPLICIHPATEIVGIVKKNIRNWELTAANGAVYQASAVLMATGYEVFDAKRKEELGYGIYNGVITSLDLERMLKEQKLLNTIGETPKRMIFVQCVGSRDEKTGNRYCSKVCCVTAVKQAVEVKRLLPETEIFVFYMDLRMWGQSFEEMYRMAQEQYNIRFVRGRISEAAGTFDGRVQIKAEDTLVGQPVRMSADLLVLMVGMEASCGTKNLAKACGIDGEYGFAKSVSPHLYDNLTNQKGLFLAGACKRPMCISDVISDARSAAFEIRHYLS